MNNRLRFPLVLLLLLLLAAAPAFSAPRAKNVILLIPDGSSFEQFTFARWCKGAPLATDAILSGAVRTSSSNSALSDSAPAATAYASGVSSSNGVIGLGPEKEGLLPGLPEPARPLAPLASILEAARLSGRSTGLVCTSRLSHATPAAFAAHKGDRDREEDIMEQLVYQGVDVAFGGGGVFLVPGVRRSNPYDEEIRRDPHENIWINRGHRLDGESLLSVLKGRGYEIASNAKEMEALKGPKAFGIFDLSHMVPEIDRKKLAPEQPDLAAMTRKAIQILSENRKGFFLMVEGSEIDWAGHANDPAQMLSGLLAFDRAVAVALEFAEKNPDTLVIVCPDHNTGGFTIGNYGKMGSDTPMSVEALTAPILAMKCSAQELLRLLGDDRSPEKVAAVVKEQWGMDIGPDEAKTLVSFMERMGGAPQYALGRLLCTRHTAVGWTSHGHCGGDVPLAATGPGAPRGLMDGPGIGKAMAQAMDLDLAAATDRLFARPEELLPGCEWSLDLENRDNPVLIIRYRGKMARFPVNKNLMIKDGKITELEGLCLYVTETGEAYVPSQVKDLWPGGEQRKGAVFSVPIKNSK